MITKFGFLVNIINSYCAVKIEKDKEPESCIFNYFSVPIKLNHHTRFHFMFVFKKTFYSYKFIKGQKIFSILYEPRIYYLFNKVSIIETFMM